MCLFSRTKQKTFNGFIDSIEWSGNLDHTILWRFPNYKAQIKCGAQLKVDKDQVAILVNNGKCADMYETGRYQLNVGNMPILASIRGWHIGYSLPFDADIFFINTKEFLNLHWGTPNPVFMSDSEFGLIRIRAFGTCSFRIKSNPIKFISKMVDAKEGFTPYSVREGLRSLVIGRFTNYLNESKICVIDLATNLNEFSDELTIALQNELSCYGIDLSSFLIDYLILPEAVEDAIDCRRI